MLAAGLLVAVIGGTMLATYLWDEDEAPLLARLATGMSVGLGVFGLLAFALAMRVGLTLTTVVVASALAAAPLTLLTEARIRARLLGDILATALWLRRHWAQAFAVVVVATLLAFVFDAAVFSLDGGLWTADHHNLGDLPFHIGIATSFLYGENFPPEHPELAGVRLTYPFLADFVAAALMRAGASLRAAFFVENVLLAWALVALLFYWGRRLTGDVLAAGLVPALVLLNGGLGFWMLARDALESARGVIPLLAALPHDYTILAPGEVRWMTSSLRWGNAVTTLLLTQRAFLFGLALFVPALTLLWEGLTPERDERTRQRRMMAAGAIAGLLPLVHVHAFVVFVCAAACLVILFPQWRNWSRFFSVVALLGVPQMLWLFVGTGLVGSSFLRWEVGWEHDRDNLLWFWFYNTGFVIPAVVWALVWRRGGRLVSGPLALFLAPFAGCFVLPNLLQLSPWMWDNIKFLFFAHVAATPIVALLLARLWRQRAPWGRWVGVALFVSMTLAGALDIVRVATRQRSLCLLDATSIAFAQLIREETPPRAVVLRLPTYTHPLLLAGRRAPLGYPGHITSQGLDAGTREADVRAIYAGVPDARERLARLGVDFIVVGPWERIELKVNDAFMATLPLVGEVDGYRLYRFHEPGR